MEDAKRHSKSRGQDEGRSVRLALYALKLPSSDSMLAFIELWDWAGRRPGQATINATFVAGLIQRNDPRSARNWIDGWIERQLLTVVDRDKRRGTYDVWIEDPREVPALKRHRPEAPLLDEIEAGDDSPEPVSSFDGAENHARVFPRAETDARTFPPESSLGGNGRAPVSAQLLPMVPAEQKTSDEQTETINELKAKLAALEDQVAEKAEAPALGLRPRTYVLSQETGDLDLVDLGPRAQPLGEAQPFPRGGPPPSRDDGKPAGAVLVADALAELFRRQKSPAEVDAFKRRIVDKIREVVADQRLQVGPCWRAAEAIVVGKLPVEDLERILDKLETMRRNEQLRDPFAFFVGSLQRRFRDLQIPWTTHARDPPPGQA